MKSASTFDFIRLKTPMVLMIQFWVLAIALWQATRSLFYLFNFMYIGTAIGVGMGIYSVLPKRQKYRGRRLAQGLIGVYMLVYLGLLARENMQIEGFFLYLLAGAIAGSVIHYLVVKILGPCCSAELGVAGPVGPL